MASLLKNYLKNLIAQTNNIKKFKTKTWRKKFKELTTKSKSSRKSDFNKKIDLDPVTENQSLFDSPFLVPPLNDLIDNATQKDFHLYLFQKLSFQKLFLWLLIKILN